MRGLKWFFDGIVELARESTLIQGLLTAALVGTYLYLLVEQLPMPEDLIQLIWLVVGFWFGSKLQIAKARAAH